MDVTPTMIPSTVHSTEPELDGLSARVKHGDKKAIPELARQFESVFMAQLVKEMRQSLEPDTLFGNDPGDVYGGLFDMFLGKHLAKSGGIGLAKMLERHLNSHDISTKTATPTNAPWHSSTKKLSKTA